ncbi:DUF192 domain-containing protein [Kaistia geumhonensis]|uniref:Uncharacterized membrane protein (UPF0127 family) n=1 Tax=Kaistia geumhonensis TaxID=410839 RepID=A0ABU0M0W8_9HYPH|nr:DUF192 domain-containing protein [Kaistia geumhonensis]MCX5480173.1 DUF192 domain-containing protein [Kaistia geumhonensis]MDQ0514598.1 uncharacterized membrane protein (UPF0127 family) [Kaistia geumhonensis]
MIAVAFRRPGGFALVLAAFLALVATLSPSLGHAAATGDKLVVTTPAGKHSFSIEWATTPDERSRGLMYRKDMPKDHGMLFDFETDQTVGFWMRNTYLPLDMLFIDATGVIKRIEHNATPLSDRLIPSGAPVRYVFEINGGRADALGISEGDRVAIPQR